MQLPNDFQTFMVYNGTASALPDGGLAAPTPEQGGFPSCQAIVPQFLSDILQHDFYTMVWQGGSAARGRAVSPAQWELPKLPPSPPFLLVWARQDSNL